jgi:hypothetical protein
MKLDIHFNAASPPNSSVTYTVYNLEASNKHGPFNLPSLFPAALRDKVEWKVLSTLPSVSRPDSAQTHRPGGHATPDPPPDPPGWGPGGGGGEGGLTKQNTSLNSAVCSGGVPLPDPSAGMLGCTQSEDSGRLLPRSHEIQYKKSRPPAIYDQYNTLCYPITIPGRRSASDLVFNQTQI